MVEFAAWTLAGLSLAIAVVTFRGLRLNAAVYDAPFGPAAPYVASVWCGRGGMGLVFDGSPYLSKPGLHGIAVHCAFTRQTMYPLGTELAPTAGLGGFRYYRFFRGCTAVVIPDWALVAAPLGAAVFMRRRRKLRAGRVPGFPVDTSR